MAEKQVAGVNYLKALAKHKKMCLAVPPVVALLAYGVSCFLPKTYLAEASVALTIIDLGANEMNIREMSAQGLLSFFRSGNLTEKTLNEFKLGLPPYNCTRHRFLNDVMTLTAPRDASTITVAVKLPDAALAAKVADFVAEGGMQTYIQEMKDQHAQMLKALGAEADAKKAELQQAEENLQQFNAKVQVQTLRSKAEVEQKLRADRETRLAGIKIDLASTGELVRSLRESLAVENPVVELKRSLTQDPMLQQAVSKQTGRPVEDLSQLSLTESVLNPMYVELASKVVEAASKQTTLQAEQSAIEQAAKASEERLVKVQEELAAAERELEGLTFTKQRAAAAATMSLERWQEKKTVAIWPPHRLTLINASVPDKPYWPKKASLCLAALLASFAAMWALAVFLESRRPQAA